MIYKDDLASAFRRLCYHPDVAAAYAFVLRTYLAIPVRMFFGSRDASSLLCLLSELRSYTSPFAHSLPLSCPTTSMIDRVSFPHAPPSSRDISPAQKYPTNQGVDGTHLGPHPMFVNDTIMEEVRSLIHQAAENSVLAVSVFFGNSGFF